MAMKVNSFRTDSFSSGLDVDLDAFVYNYRYICRRVAPAKVIAVIKANAMGHGTRTMGKALEAAGAEMLAVSHFLEAILLRDAGVRTSLLVLNGLTPLQMKQAIEMNISFFGHDLTALTVANDIAKQVGMPAKVHVEVDTGMGRTGILPWQVAEARSILQNLTGLKVEGVASHLASPYLTEHDGFSRQQCELLVEAAKLIDPEHKAMWHLAASSGTIRFPDMRLDAVRVGAILYGVSRVWPLPWALKPTSSYRTCVVQVKRIPKGHNVGYRLHYTASKDTIVAILPVGTTDTLTSDHADFGQVLIRGKRCPIISLCSCEGMVDVTAVPEVTPGDEVVLFGSQGDDEITAVEFAELGKTSYAGVLTRIPIRTPRIYWKNGAVINAEVMGTEINLP